MTRSTGRGSAGRRRAAVAVIWAIFATVLVLDSNTVGARAASSAASPAVEVASLAARGISSPEPPRRSECSTDDLHPGEQTLTECDVEALIDVVVRTSSRARAAELALATQLAAIERALKDPFESGNPAEYYRSEFGRFDISETSLVVDDAAIEAITTKYSEQWHSATDVLGPDEQGNEIGKTYAAYLDEDVNVARVNLAAAITASGASRNNLGNRFLADMYIEAMFALASSAYPGPEEAEFWFWDKPEYTSPLVEYVDDASVAGVEVFLKHFEEVVGSGRVSATSYTQFVDSRWGAKTSHEIVDLAFDTLAIHHVKEAHTAQLAAQGFTQQWGDRLTFLYDTISNTDLGMTFFKPEFLTGAGDVIGFSERVAVASPNSMVSVVAHWSEEGSQDLVTGGSGPRGAMQIFAIAAAFEREHDGVDSLVQLFGTTSLEDEFADWLSKSLTVLSLAGDVQIIPDIAAALTTAVGLYAGALGPQLTDEEQIYLVLSAIGLLAFIPGLAAIGPIVAVLSWAIWGGFEFVRYATSVEFAGRNEERLIEVLRFFAPTADDKAAVTKAGEYYRTGRFYAATATWNDAGWFDYEQPNVQGTSFTTRINNIDYTWFNYVTFGHEPTDVFRTFLSNFGEASRATFEGYCGTNAVLTAAQAQLPASDDACAPLQVVADSELLVVADDGNSSATVELKGLVLNATSDVAVEWEIVGDRHTSAASGNRTLVADEFVASVQIPVSTQVYDVTFKASDANQSVSTMFRLSVLSHPDDRDGTSNPVTPYEWVAILSDQSNPLAGPPLHHARTELLRSLEKTAYGRAYFGLGGTPPGTFQNKELACNAGRYMPPILFHDPRAPYPSPTPRPTLTTEQQLLPWCEALSGSLGHNWWMLTETLVIDALFAITSGSAPKHIPKNQVDRQVVDRISHEATRALVYWMRSASIGTLGDSVDSSHGENTFATVKSLTLKHAVPPPTPTATPPPELNAAIVTPTSTRTPGQQGLNLARPTGMELFERNGDTWVRWQDNATSETWYQVLLDGDQVTAVAKNATEARLSNGVLSRTTCVVVRAYAGDTPGLAAERCVVAESTPTPTPTATPTPTPTATPVPTPLPAPTGFRAELHRQNARPTNAVVRLFWDAGQDRMRVSHPNVTPDRYAQTADETTLSVPGVYEQLEGCWYLELADQSSDKAEACVEVITPTPTPTATSTPTPAPTPTHGLWGFSATWEDGEMAFTWDANEAVADKVEIGQIPGAQRAITHIPGGREFPMADEQATWVMTVDEATDLCWDLRAVVVGLAYTARACATVITPTPTPTATPAPALALPEVEGFGVSWTPDRKYWRQGNDGVLNFSWVPADTDLKLRIFVTQGDFDYRTDNDGDFGVWRPESSSTLCFKAEYVDGTRRGPTTGCIRPTVNDTARIAAVDETLAALEAYGRDNGTYLVTGTGWARGSQGWFSYTGGRYSKSIADGLAEAGYLDADDLPHDPLQSRVSDDFMVYRCKDRVGVFAKSDAAGASAKDSQWWTDNGCIRGPIDTYDHRYFVLSESLTCDSKPVTVWLSQGHEPTTGDDVILGTEGNDTVKANFGDDVICALGGDDVISGNQGDDRIFGGAGNDRLYGGYDSDVVYGEAGNDTIVNNRGTDTMRGGDGDDTITGGIHADTIYGDDGDDTMNGRQGDDRIWGGYGNDHLIGSTGNDFLAGNINDDHLEGGDGDDELHGGYNNDKVYGGNGNDKLVNNRGNDLMDGGTGTDTCTRGNGTDTLISC